MQDSSIAAWRDAIRADTFVNYHLEMGIVLLEQDPPAAVLHFRKAVDILPQRPDHHLLLVQALTASGKAEDAHAADRAARAAHPDYRSRGLIHMALRQLQNLDAGKAQPLLDAAEREAAEREGERPELRLARFALRCLVETDPGTPAAAASR